MKVKYVICEVHEVFLFDGSTRLELLDLAEFDKMDEAIEEVGDLIEKSKNKDHTIQYTIVKTYEAWHQTTLSKP